MNTKLTFLVVGIALVLISFILGFIFKNDGCGACYPNNYIPQLTVAIIYIPTFSRPSAEQCSVMGCSAGTIIPVFLDLYGLGLVSLFKGLMLLRK